MHGVGARIAGLSGVCTGRRYPRCDSTDRLARSTLRRCQIAEELRRKEVHLQVLDQQIHTNDATWRLLFHMLGAIAQFETELRAERQMDGIALAKARGVVFGRGASREC
jgi:DNA invertase Pin-like site-specific DNA recombinase